MLPLWTDFEKPSYLLKLCLFKCSQPGIKQNPVDPAVGGSGEQKMETVPSSDVSGHSSSADLKEAHRLICTLAKACNLSFLLCGD